MIQLTIWKIQSEKITFNFLLNIARLLQSVIAVGNEFHIVTDRYRKDRCPEADLYPRIYNFVLISSILIVYSNPSDKAGTEISRH